MKNRIKVTKRLRPGQRIMTSGYEGVVTSLYSDGPNEGSRMYEVRLPGGPAAICGSDLEPVGASSASSKRDPRLAPPKAGSHVFRLNIQPIDKEPHEYVELYRSSDPLVIAWNGGYIVIAYRYGRELVRFIPTRPMLKRLMNEIPGKITITKEMIDRARLIVPT